MSDAPFAASARCPECGYDESTGLPPHPPLSWRVTWPAWVAFCALIGLGVWLYVDRKSARIGSGTPIPVLVKPGFDRDDLPAIAAGARTDAGLFDAVESSVATWIERYAHYGDVRLEPSLIDGAADRITTRAFGWPLRWWQRTTTECYIDPIGRREFQPISTDLSLSRSDDPFNASVWDGVRVAPRPRWQWRYFTVFHKPPPEETGGRLEWSSWNLRAIGATLGLVGLAWLVGAGIGWIVDVIRFGRGRSSIAGRVRRAVVALVVLAIAVGATLTYDASWHVRATMKSSMLSAPVPAGASQSIPVDELLAHAADPGRDRWLAGAVLEKLPASDKSVYAYLAMRAATDWSTSGALTIVSESLPIANLFEETAASSSPSQKPVHFPAFELEWNAPTFWVSFGDGATRKRVALNLDTLGLVCLGLMLLVMPILIVRHRIEARRKARGGCRACGHALRPSTS